MRTTLKIPLLMVMFCLSPALIYAGQPGVTDTVFNRRFIRKVQPMMPLDQLVKLAGTAGEKAGEDRRSSPPAIRYHWKGGRKSALDIKVAAGKVIELTVTAPKQQKLSLGRNGDVVESED